MRPLRILFITLILLLSAALISKKTDLSNLIFEELQQGFTQDAEQEKQVENKKAKNNSSQESQKSQTKAATSTRKLPSVARAPESKPLEVKIEISTPPPLRAQSGEGSSVPPSAGGLTGSGIIYETNLQRQQNSLGFLTENGILDAMALKKADDMCEKQYFAHTSPSGVGAADLANSFGYDYLSIGENLALGNFADDQAVVQAWMNSPGHRANILNSRFTEIGVGARKCLFEGRSTWLAVQHFGRPASICRRPDETLKSKIDSDRASLTDLKSKLMVLRAEIEASGPETNPNYYSRVDEYNSLVKQYNNLLASTSNFIKEYNSEVGVFNQCAG